MEFQFLNFNKSVNSVQESLPKSGDSSRSKLLDTDEISKLLSGSKAESSQAKNSNSSICSNFSINKAQNSSIKSLETTIQRDSYRNYSFSSTKTDKGYELICTDKINNKSFNITLTNFTEDALNELLETLKQASDELLADLCAETQTINYNRNLAYEGSIKGAGHDADTDIITFNQFSLENLAHEVGHAVSNTDDNHTNTTSGINCLIDSQQNLFNTGLARFFKGSNSRFSQNFRTDMYATNNVRDCYAECYTLLMTGNCYSKEILLKYFPEALLAVQKDIEKTRTLTLDKRNLPNNSNEVQNYNSTKSKIKTETLPDGGKKETFIVDNRTITVTTNVKGRTSTDVKKEEENYIKYQKGGGYFQYKTTEYSKDFDTETSLGDLVEIHKYIEKTTFEDGHSKVLERITKIDSNGKETNNEKEYELPANDK